MKLANLQLLEAPEREGVKYSYLLYKDGEYHKTTESFPLSEISVRFSKLLAHVEAEMSATLLNTDVQPMPCTLYKYKIIVSENSFTIESETFKLIEMEQIVFVFIAEDRPVRLLADYPLMKFTHVEEKRYNYELAFVLYSLNMLDRLELRRIFIADSHIFFQDKINDLADKLARVNKQAVAIFKSTYHSN